MPKEKQKASSFAKASEDKEKKKLNLEKLKKKLRECERLKDEYLAGWKRARADFLNYKKGELERIGEIIKYANSGLILKILPILDNLELAEKGIPVDLKNNENIKGLLQIKTQLQDFLKNQGIEEIESMGQKFDPNVHEIVEEVEAKNQKSGIIISEVQRGYKLHGKLIRVAKVKVTK